MSTSIYVPFKNLAEKILQTFSNFFYSQGNLAQIAKKTKSVKMMYDTIFKIILGLLDLIIILF